MKKELALFVLLCQVYIATTTKLVLNTSPLSPLYVAINTELITLNCSISQYDQDDVISLQWKYEKHGRESEMLLNNASLVLKIVNISYTDEAMYNCTAVNQTSGDTLAHTNIKVIVGDPPEVPPLPELVKVCGYPPNDVLISYQHKATWSNNYATTLELLLSQTKTDCFDVAISDFKFVKQSKRTVDAKINVSFEVNVGPIVKDMFPDFPECYDSSYCVCPILWGLVGARNLFGTTYSHKQYWNIETKARCGKVDDLRASEIGGKSVMLSWDIPKCLTNTSKSLLYYWLWCEPSCGDKLRLRKYIGDGPLNYTFRSLVEYTNYIFYVSCSFFSIDDNGEKTAIKIQTKEGVPKDAPIIDGIGWQDQTSKCGIRLHNGTALISWKAVTDKDALLGKLRNYLITFWTSNSTLRSERLVHDGTLHLEIPGLRMDSDYSFTIKACTGAGCGKVSPVHSLKSATILSCESSPTNQVEVSQKQNLLNVLLVIGGLIVFIIICILICVIKIKKDNARVDLPPLPDEGIYPTQEDFPPDQQKQQTTNNDYASATVEVIFNDQAALADDVIELKTSNTCLSRSSSCATSSTDL